MVAESQTGSVRDFPAYLHFTPRPDQPELYDEQTAFYESDTDGVTWLLGGNGAGTTSCLIAKICRFVLETPPPRRDTPFWIIAESYQQVGSMWDEKFDQQGHLPPDCVDRPRIQWHKVNNNWPFRVPLKSPPGSPGKNWCLEFKSWRQGRGQMQARSLGGFGFIEQFPWGDFEEVLRGCREYNFPGSKLVEYTPVDPDLSLDIEEMMENGTEPLEGKQLGVRYLPRNWKIYHANTACAAAAGHVDKRWFEEFFGMVPEEMLDTRMKGLFSTFEGVIYKQFNPTIHCMGDEMWSRIKNCHHRRGIDWGAGPENDFVCLWGAKNGLGQWFVYDEIACHDQSKTTVDHLSDVYHRWEWPGHNKLYGAAYADPSSPDNIRIAGKLNQYNPEVDFIQMARGKNAVLEGIEHLQYLLKPQIPVPYIDQKTGEGKVRYEPRLFIHRTNCPKLIQQMKTYRWLRGSDPTLKGSRNPKDPRREPLKKNDHGCFAAYVPVMMADGTQKPIIDVKVGDFVLSHLGITRVIASEFTGIRKTISLQGNSGLIRCTAEHPWYNSQSGLYCPANEVQTLCRLCDTPRSPETLSNAHSGAGTGGDDIQIPRMTASECTSVDLRGKGVDCCNTFGCTKKSGSRFTENFQKDTRFTTETKIQPTTPSTTCNLSQRKNTDRSIETTSIKLSQQHQNGIEATKDGHGTANMGNVLQRVYQQKQPPASTAERSTQHEQPETQSNTVLANADTMPERRRNWTTNHEPVLSVENHSPWTNTRRFLPVLTPVREFECRILPETEQVEKVYNLATEDGTFFADGLLTSNCDALRYMCFTDDSHSGLTISSQKSSSVLIAQMSGDYTPRQGERNITTQHRNRRDT